MKELIGTNTGRIIFGVIMSITGAIVVSCTKHSIGFYLLIGGLVLLVAQTLWLVYNGFFNRKK